MLTVWGHTHRVVAALHLMLGDSVGGAVPPGEAGAGGDGPRPAQGLRAHLHVRPGRHHPGQGTCTTNSFYTIGVRKKWTEIIISEFVTNNARCLTIKSYLFIKFKEWAEKSLFHNIFVINSVFYVLVHQSLNHMRWQYYVCFPGWLSVSVSTLSFRCWFSKCVNLCRR